MTGCGGPTDSSDRAQSGGDPVVAVAVLAPSESFDANVSAMKKAVAAAGIHNAKYKMFDAQGDPGNIPLIVKRIVDLKPTLAYEIGTPLIQATAQAAPTIPIFFGLMLDPIGAGVVKSLEKPGGNATGVVLSVPSDYALNIVRKSMPEATRIGMIGNTAQQNTEQQISELTAEAKKHSMSVQVAPVATTNDVQLAVKSLAGKVDALLVPADNTVVGAIDVVVKTATDAGLPTFSMFNPAGDSVVAMGQSYAKLGAEAGLRVAKILQGARIGSIPVLVPGTDGIELSMNRKSAESLHVTLPSNLSGQ